MEADGLRGGRLAGHQEWFGDSYGSYRDVTWDIEVALGITYELRGGRIGHVRVYVGHDRARDAVSSGG